MLIRNPRLVFNDAGTGGGGGTATVDAPPAPAAPAPAAPAAPTAPAAPVAGEAPKVVIDGKEVDVAQLLADNAKFQREADAARVSAKAQVAKDAQKAQLLSVAKIAGIEIADEGAETIESLTEKLVGKATVGDQNTAEATKAKRDAAVVQAAWKAGAPADKADYLNFKAAQDPELAKLDPSAADYQTSVDARIKAIVDGDPIFKATPGGAGRSGAEGFSGAGGPEVVTQEAFDAMDVLEQTKLYQTNPELFRRLAGAE
ncbi:scaffolding protein [Microbacterium phage Milani]|nr:scaffolding protein [Microbacterium phage Milani]